ncbi:MAG: MarR family transcriptional regulator [Thermoleophilia bacterium]|nr:MarR family transcriptional regulator [Thermoleophilia bacterium]
MTPPRTGSPSPAAAVAARADNMMGVHAAGWSPDERLAWEGLLDVARVLRRDAEAHLDDEHGLSVTTLGVMGRLLRAPDQALRLTDLSDAMGLSVSRVSRVIDALAARGFVLRRSCPTDARAVHVVLQPAGRAAAEAAQESIEAHARARFVDRLTPEETAMLAGVFARLIDGPVAGDCAGGG